MHIFQEIKQGILLKDSFPSNWDIRLRYLGTAGFVFSSHDRTIVVDPYVSRPSAWKSATQKLTPDLARIQSYIPEANDVLVGHAHHDVGRARRRRIRLH